MKRTTPSLLAIAAVIGFATASNAQETATATATAPIVTPISITKTIDMNFGNVSVQSSVGGTVVLAPAGGRTSTGGVTLPAVSGTVAAAAFLVTGQEDYNYDITLPSSQIALEDGESHVMYVDDFTSNPSSTGTLTAGSQVVNVGATLLVGAAQAAGVYVSPTPFQVTVNYN